jgi:hypothetical protein
MDLLGEPYSVKQAARPVESASLDGFDSLSASGCSIWKAAGLAACQTRAGSGSSRGEATS